MANVNEIEITEDMLEAVATAQLYREDPMLALRKVGIPKLTNDELKAFYKRLLKDPRLGEYKENAIKIEEAANFTDDNVDTIMLYYNKLLKDAQFEKKYEVVLRILKEIRQLKAIENEQMKFEIVIKVEEPKKANTSDATL